MHITALHALIDFIDGAVNVLVFLDIEGTFKNINLCAIITALSTLSVNEVLVSLLDTSSLKAEFRLLWDQQTFSDLYAAVLLLMKDGGMKIIAYTYYFATAIRGTFRIHSVTYFREDSTLLRSGHGQSGLE